VQLPGFSLHHSKIIVSIASSNLGGVALYQPYQFKRKVQGGGESQFTPMKISYLVEASLDDEHDSQIFKLNSLMDYFSI